MDELTKEQEELLNEYYRETPRGLIIGTSSIFGIEKELYLVSCGNCEGLFNIPKTYKMEQTSCPNCKEIIKLKLCE
jgi:hypothetical protein